MKIFTMVKGEVDIVKDWVMYHGNLFGFTNLYIIDNFSRDGTYEILLKLLDDFQPNMCFFEKDDIDDTFVRQIVEFAEKIIKINVDHNEITNLLMTCMIENDEIIEKATNCSKFLSKTYVDKIFSSKYKEWVVTNNFQ